MARIDTITKTVRLPADLMNAAEEAAREKGLTVTDIIERALRSELNFGQDPGFELLDLIRRQLQERYEGGKGFPIDVTLQVFRGIRADPRMRALYLQATGGLEGSVNDPRVGTLNRRIGRMVKVALDARPVGRSNPLDPQMEWISSHALLVPAA